MSRLVQRRDVSGETPHDDTAPYRPHPDPIAHVFTEQPAIASLILPQQAIDFVRVALQSDRAQLQTTAQGGADLYQHVEIVDQQGRRRRHEIFRLRLATGQQIQGRMSTSFSLTLDQLIAPRTAWQRINLARGAVYVALNELAPHQPRRDMHVTAIRALALDLDGAPLPDQWPLPPTAIVETSPSRYQVVWRTTGIPVQQFRAAQRWLATRYGGDPALCNPSCVVRLPGSIHYKEVQPHPVRLLRLTDAGYRWPEVLRAYPDLATTLSQSAARKQFVPMGNNSRYATAALVGEANKVAGAPPGERNNQLFKSAAALGGMIAAGALDEGMVCAALRAAAGVCGLPEPEVELTLASGIRRGKSTPRTFMATGRGT